MIFLRPPELDPEARAIIDAARGGHEPNELNRARVRRGVELKLAAGLGLLFASTTTARGERDQDHHRGRGPGNRGRGRRLRLSPVRRAQTRSGARPDRAADCGAGRGARRAANALAAGRTGAPPSRRAAAGRQPGEPERGDDLARRRKRRARPPGRDARAGAAGRIRPPGGGDLGGARDSGGGTHRPPASWRCARRDATRAHAPRHAIFEHAGRVRRSPLAWKVHAQGWLHHRRPLPVLDPHARGPGAAGRLGPDGHDPGLRRWEDQVHRLQLRRVGRELPG